jgi:hypothetical protein
VLPLAAHTGLAPLTDLCSYTDSPLQVYVKTSEYEGGGFQLFIKTLTGRTRTLEGMLGFMTVE